MVIELLQAMLIGAAILSAIGALSLAILYVRTRVRALAEKARR